MTQSTGRPARGDVWLVDLNPIRGHEQAGRRPALVISVDQFNVGPAGLVILLPITSTLRPIPARIRLKPPEGGLTKESDVICEAIRSVSVDRLVGKWGAVSATTLKRTEEIIKMLLGFK